MVNLRNVISVVQIFLAALFIGAVLLQVQGTGLGRAFGGEGTSYHTKRGVEKFLFFATIALAVLFIAAALTGVIVG